MSNHINKDDPKRWFYIQNNESGESSLILFGNLGEVNQSMLETGQPILINYLTEDELQSAVNDIADDDQYYKNAVETENDKFMMPSNLYEYGAQLIDELPEEFEE